MRKYLFLLITVILLLTGCSCADSDVVLDDGTLNGQEDAAFLVSDDVKDSPVEQEITAPDTIFVYVCGEVLNPGVYEIDSGARVVDAVSAAGGLLDTADDTYVNLAAPLEDGVKLMIPSREELQEKSDDPKRTVSDKEGAVISRGITKEFDNSDDGGGLININTASITELTALPGIGESIAGKIVGYRDEHGRFECIEDIMRISGIKDKLFQKIKDKITV